MMLMLMRRTRRGSRRMRSFQGLKQDLFLHGKAISHEESSARKNRLQSNS